MTDFLNAIGDLAKSTRQHRALNNPFYDKWTKRQLSFDEAEVFLVNYCAWIETVTEHIARVFLATADLEARCETIKNLYSEMGCGNPEKAHITLLRKFAVALLTELGGKPYQLPETSRSPLLQPSTRTLIESQSRLFGNASPQIAAGALLAQEWQAFTMLVQLYDGARLYIPTWKDPEDFHDAAEYFYIHIGEAEKEHKIQSVKSASQDVHSEADLVALREGHADFLDVLADFWQGISSRMEARPARASQAGAVASV